MRLSVLLCLAGLLDATFAAALVGDTLRTGSGGLRRSPADFDGFHFLDDPAAEAHHYLTEHVAETSTSASPTSSKSSADTITTGVSSSATSTKKGKETESIPTGTAYSVIGSIPPLATHSSLQASTPAPASPTSSAPVAANAAATSGGGNSEWKIIGVAVIAFSAVAAILLLSVFFDHWWRFVRDLLGRRRRRTTEEELVPDWEKAEWDLKFADRHRYPSFTSLPSIPIVAPLAQQAHDVQSPPQAAHIRAGRDMRTHERGPARHLDGTFGGRPPSRFEQVSPQAHAGYAGVGIVGLGLDGVGPGNDGGRRISVVSPRTGGGNRRTPSPLSQHTPRLGPSQTSTTIRRGGNPFDDCHSPLPEDVYGGMH